VIPSAAPARSNRRNISTASVVPVERIEQHLETEGPDEIRPRARQLGVAAALVRATVDRLRAQGRDVLELEVLASNERARSVYERWGFEPAEVTLATNIGTLVERLRSNGGAARTSTT
jgi:GNAT superfamily N-acetyltransferase